MGKFSSVCKFSKMYVTYLTCVRLMTGLRVRNVREFTNIRQFSRMC